MKGRNVVCKQFMYSYKCKVHETCLCVTGAHAREWIGPATVLHLLMSQVVNCDQGISCDMEYYFMPSVNPDGYTYSWQINRLWRKNRSAPPDPSSSCYGTDINRNWGYKFGLTGCSANPCSDVYKGTGPFSEPETVAIKNVIDHLVETPNTDLLLYISYHSYGQLVLFPWCYGTAQDSYSNEIIKLATIYSESVHGVYQSDYTPKQAAYLYPAAGCSMDYIRSRSIKNVFTVELRGNTDDNKYGFVLPANQILPTFEENKAGFDSVLEYLNKS